MSDKFKEQTVQLISSDSKLQKSKSYNNNKDFCSKILTVHYHIYFLQATKWLQTNRST